MLKYIILLHCSRTRPAHTAFNPLIDALTCSYHDSKEGESRRLYYLLDMNIDTPMDLYQESHTMTYIHKNIRTHNK